MDNFSYPKGSMWRKWDLQTHTIFDDDYVSLDQYYLEIKRADPSGWQQYIDKVGGEDNALLFDSKKYFTDTRIKKTERCLNYVRNYFAFLDIFNPELECVGISDHNYFDDCLLDTFIDYSKKSRCKTIPGVEINCQGIHMLLYFHDNLYQKESFSAGISAFLVKFNIDNHRNKEGALTTTSVDIKKILDEVKKNEGIVIYPHCNSNNGLFQERTSTDRTHLADIYNYQKVNLLQSQNNRSLTAVAEIIKNKVNLTSKYCCHISSDGKSLRDFGKCDKDNNYLWIKSDPTFEGLKQIIYEPEHRIFIGPQKPGEKKSYFIIDKVRFLDTSGDLQFSSEPIEINQNLTTIIGGKSTGKSLLLHHIAKTIDPEEVRNRTSANGGQISYDFDSSVDFNFEVLWKDSQRSLLKTQEEVAGSESKQRKILYIPQKYLNVLSETDIKSREALNKFVLAVILQDQAFNEKYQETMLEIKETVKSIPDGINELFLVQDDINNIEEELKRIGDQKGIISYIQLLQKEADTIKVKSGLSDKQIKQYEDLGTREKNINIQISQLEEDKKTIKALSSTLVSKIRDIHTAVDETEVSLNDPGIRTLFKIELKVVDSFDSLVKSAISNLITAIEEKIKSYKTELISIRNEIAPLLAKVQLQTELQTKNDNIQKEQTKLNEISIKQNNLKTKKASFKKKAKVAIDSYKQIIAKYEDLRSEFKKFESKFGDISLSVDVAFNQSAFNREVVNEYLNKNDLKRAIIELEWGEEYIYKYDPTKHIRNLTLIFEGLISGTIKTVKSRPAKDAIIKLLENYYYFDFHIFYNNDSFDKMSPGKKGLVLLRLLINLSNEEWPILLDQPEDDLDNRSVYADLVEFLKKKKLQRQIIVVTHNPNLVVGADAEETIVANQSGQEVGRENKKYRFEYVSGALENAFELSDAQESAVLLRKGIRQHVCEILEGGKEAFQKREQKYSFPNY